MSQFDRKITCEIGTAGQEGTLIDGLRIKFHIEKTKGSSINKAEIEIYNLTKETINKLSKIDNHVILSAGYNDMGYIQQIFSGTMSSAVTIEDPPERIYTIEALDGGKKLRETYESYSYDEGTQIESIISDLQIDLDFPSGRLPVIAETLPNGWSYIGDVRSALTSVLNMVDYDWYLQDEEFIIVRKGETSSKQAVSLTPESGLIGSPEPEDDSYNELRPKKRKGYKVKCLLNPLINPAGQVEIVSNDIDGFYKVYNLTHDGDNYGGEFITEFDCKEFVV